MYRLLPVLTGLLLALAATLPALAWLAVVAFWPLFHYAERPGLSAGRVWLGSIVSGLTYFALNLSWILVKPPQEWAQVGAFTGTVAKIVIWLVGTLCLSLGFAVFGAVLAKYRRRLAAPEAWLSLTAAWIFGEAAHGFFLTIIAWGPGASIGPLWNNGSLGFVTAPTPLVQAGALLGLWGLAGLVLLANLAFWQATRRRFRAAAGLGTLVLILPVLGALWPLHEATPVSVSALQLPRPSGHGETDLVSYLDRQPRLSPAAVLVVPEQGDYFQGDLTGAEKRLVRASLKSDGLIVGSRTVYRSGRPNTGETYYLAADGRPLHRQEKRLLVPGGEYLPAFLEIALQLSGHGDQVRGYEANRRLKRGGGREQPYEYGGVSYGALSCSSIMTPQNYRHLTAGGATVLVNTASLLIMSDQPVYLNQNRAMARFHAVANGRPFIQAARSGRNYIITARGKFLVDSPADGFRVDQAAVRPATGRTPYSILGEWTVWPALLVLLWSLAKRVRRKI